MSKEVVGLRLEQGPMLFEQYPDHRLQPVKLT